MKTRVLLAALAAALAASLVFARPALAITVFDPTNFVQNKLTAVRTLEQINNQIKQLQNEEQVLRNQARNLASLDFNIVNRLRSTLANTDRLIAEARGLAYDVRNMDATFARLYPERYAATVSGDQMHRDAQERWQNTLNGLHTAMRMQAQASRNLAQDESAIADLVRQSQSATGALQATQATNQLLALQAKQAIQAQQLQLTQERAVSLELARQAAAAERGREVTRRFLGTGTRYTQRPVSFYNR
ncbi:P-type conjugative transfer protein TrbJ [Cupriavidus sp. IDO]|uniref:P-type conjugative transfer protein TrbJ n=1 Tax=Cupriavidus sp. IDO TaxID=1539142 RepID=UPI0005794B67|nr:P-type conjugative transfer protein TrbJ [Cupriavidus sp. IDO]KWR77239.1 conjugal transfer protein TrbJ [Cupriavidus sp. IDO]